MGTAEGGADLHAHTTASDGRQSPEELVALAARVGLEALGVTDHDTQAGIPPAREAGARLGIRIVPGIELSTDWRPGREVHVLGYFCRPEELQALLDRQVSGRAGRMERMVAQLQAAGVPVELERVRQIAAGAPLGRPHLARALVAGGWAPDIPTAFERYLVPGRPGYAPRPRLTPTEAVAAIHAAGGAAVLAHPALVGDDAIIPELVSAGLDGIEVRYTQHRPEDVERYQAVAERHGLVATGGSDFHGEGHAGELGEVRVAARVVDALAARARPPGRGAD